MIKNYFFILLIFLFIIVCRAQNIAEIRAIDRITGRSYKLQVPLNSEVIFSNLIINIKYCYKNPIDKEIENYAFIEVKEKLAKKLIFKGWMFSSSPSLNSLEHPVNDIWLLNCQNDIN